MQPDEQTDQNPIPDPEEIAWQADRDKWHAEQAARFAAIRADLAALGAELRADIAEAKAKEAAEAAEVLK